LRDTIGVDLLLVAEGDRFERENRFAHVVHRFDLVLETLRGGRHAKLTVGIYNNRYAVWNGCPADPGDKGARRDCANANSVRLIRKPIRTQIANVDIVISPHETTASVIAQCDVAAGTPAAKPNVTKRPRTNRGVTVPDEEIRESVSTDGRVPRATAAEGSARTVGRVAAAGCVVNERFQSGGCVIPSSGIESERFKPITRVIAAGGVAVERAKPGGRVLAAVGVVIKRLRTVGHAQAAGGVAKERLKTGRGVLIADSSVIEGLITEGGIPDAGCEAKKSVLALSGVAAGIAPVRCRGNRLNSRRKRKAAERERDEKETAPQRRAAD
jgi:hypothetical protein